MSLSFHLSPYLSLILGSIHFKLTKGDSLMQIDQLKYFIEVVRKGSINLACDGLHISQQALSQSMRNLEKEIGFTFLIRHHKGITLTEKGQEFFYAAVDIVDRWEILLAKLNENLNGTLRVSIAPFIEEYYYTSLLYFIENHHLPIQLEVINLLPYEAVQLLEKDELDLSAISFFQNTLEAFLKQHKTLLFIPKKQIKLNILVSKYSTLAKKAVIDFSHLDNQRIIIEKSELETDYMRKLLKSNPSANVLTTNSFYAKQSMIANNLGIALSIESGPILSNYAHELVEIPLQGYETMISGILISQNSPKDKLLREILKAW